MPAQPVRKIDLDDNPQDYAPDYEGDIYAGTLRRA
jgi:hypothetical protein